MNRALIFCIAIFFAVVGIALLGADSAAVAGHGCCGCNGGCGGCGGYDCCGCHGYSACGCCGYSNGCGHNGCGHEAACGCCGYGGGYNGHGGAPVDAPAAEPAPPAAPAPAAYRRAPAGFRVVSFRR
jgi:hypothetical protein